MGVRVHKILGYGLVDVKTEDGEIVDDRFNIDFIDKFNTEEFSIESYISFLTSLENDYECQIEINTVKNKKWHIYDSIQHDSEYGLPEVFCIIPVGFSDWRRYDDTIDYYEETINKKQKNHFQVIPFGIFPWQGFYADVRRKKIFKGIEQEIASALKRNLQKNKEESIKRIGIFSVDDIQPVVPKSIFYLCEFLNVFNIEDTVWTLKPMLYTYWS